MIWFIHEGSPQKVNKTGISPKYTNKAGKKKTPLGQHFSEDKMKLFMSQADPLMQET